VPAIRSDENRLEFIGHNEPGSIVSEAYRSIRTSLLLSFPDRPPTALLVTSPAPSEGKTATAINLAISLTHTGARALLVSTDLRKPKIDAVFDIRSRGGIAGVLAGDVGLESAIIETGVPNLSILPCGVMPPNPVELLMSKRFQLLVSALRSEYDFVVFDSPPVGHVSDARILARYMDCTILVVRAGQTSKHLAHNVLDQLTSTPGSNTAGVVLNDVDAATVGEYAYTGAYKTRSAHG
jgi:capsular exopolysaccharide synthesis family protein